jgi:hypothetical protein
MIYSFFYAHTTFDATALTEYGITVDHVVARVKVLLQT